MFNFIFIVLTETWLTENFSDCELGLCNFNIFRYDRCISNSTCLRGGGVLIGVRKDITSRQITVSEMNVEHIFVELSIGSSKFVVGGVYIPPLSSSIIYESHLNSIEYLNNHYPGHTFIICGDYNIPEVSWDNDDNGLTYFFTSSSRASCVPEAFSSLNFYQNNNIINCSNSILDLVFCNNKFLTIEKSLEPAVPIDPYHPALNISLPASLPMSHCNRDHIFFNFRKANYDKLRSFFDSFDWCSTFLHCNTDSAFNILYDALHHSVLEFVPKCTFRESTYPPWFTKELKHILLSKKQAHTRFKSSKSITDYKEFSILRAKFKYQSKKAYRGYTEQVETSLKSNPSEFWRYVKNNRFKNNIPKDMTYNNITSSSEEMTANLFSTYFSSVYIAEQIDLNASTLGIPTFDLPSHVSFSADDVFHRLLALKGEWSIGPDGLSGHFLYELRAVLALPLWTLFRRSLDEGSFPSMLKFSSITPIFKSGNRNIVSNYRPIAIQSHISKIFDSLVLSSIQPSINSILMEEQHGFRPGRSTTTCNLVFSNYVYNSFQNRSQVDVIYTDFKKAFDSVNHNALIMVLKESGIGEPLLSWFRSYLSDRYHWVKVFGIKSNVFLASSGVPQGGHLSPLLFSLFINSIHRHLQHCHLLCFADDIKLYMSVSTIDDCLKLQIDINTFSEWFDKLGLSLNLSKCKVMTFTRIHSPIVFSYRLGKSDIIRVTNDCVMDLGFKFNSKLDPGPHINYVCCKALKTLGFIMRLSRDFRLELSIKSLYCALVRPILEYGAIVWDPVTAGHSSELERVQRRFLRFSRHLLNIPCTPHDYAPVADVLNLSSLAERRRSAGLSFLKGLLCNKVDSSVLVSLLNFKVPQRITRATAPFFIPHSTTNYLGNEPIRRLMSHANADPSFLESIFEY